jgi:prepilin-type N-terminal cleavage/methylation domain-containing protein
MSSRNIGLIEPMRPPNFHPRRSGFTLVELIVSMAILAIIGLVIGQMVSTTAKITVVNAKHTDANSQARTVFDRMEEDFARMVKRNDVDYIFWKVAGGAGGGGNDTMFFYSEAASYFTSTIYSPYTTRPYAYKNSISLIGYRINNDSTTPSPNCYQLERLGEPLSWDGAPVNAPTIYPTPVVFLTYPYPPPTSITTLQDSGDPPYYGNPATSAAYSAAVFNSTLAGAFSKGGTCPPSVVGTQALNFNNCTIAGGDTYNPSFYNSIGTQVFRFEYSFVLKDGTQAVIPVMTPSTANGLPTSKLNATQPPLGTDDSAGNDGGTKYSVGSRWYDTTNQIGYICLDATPNVAVWHEIGIQDISAIVITIAVMDNQGIVLLNSQGTLNTVMPQLQAQLVDANPPNDTAQVWTAALASGNVASAVALPQSIVSQIRVYERAFYINNF